MTDTDTTPSLADLAASTYLDLIDLASHIRSRLDDGELADLTGEDVAREVVSILVADFIAGIASFPLTDEEDDEVQEAVDRLLEEDSLLEEEDAEEAMDALFSALQEAVRDGFYGDEYDDEYGDEEAEYGNDVASDYAPNPRQVVAQAAWDLIMQGRDVEVEQGDGGINLWVRQ